MNVYLCTVRPRAEAQPVTLLVGSPDAEKARQLTRGDAPLPDKDILVVLLPKVSYDGQEPAVIRKL